MVDVQTVSIAVASAGVFLAAIYYILQIRHQTRIRQTDMLWRIYSSFNSKEMLEAGAKLQNLEFRDYSDFVKKYGQFTSEGPVTMAIGMICNLYEGVGIFLHRQLIDFELASEFLPISMTWEKIKPVIEGARQQYNNPSLFEWFEYLYNEMQKREQKLQSKKG
ncbi:MAG TPA: hypothetical protein VMS94_02565 [Acidobacteriota bacterium]|nr:hypothetical protein [Acidobacteriota bacterium]